MHVELTLETWGREESERGGGRRVREGERGRVREGRGRVREGEGCKRRSYQESNT